MVDNSVTAEDIKSRAFEGMNEETVCARLVVPYLTDVLGWDIRDVYAEYRVHESHAKKVDYALPTEQEPSLLVEVKSLGTNLQNETDQLSEYLCLSDVDYGLLTDGVRYILIERSDEGSNSVNSQFEIVDEPPTPVSCNNNKARKSRNSGDFLQDISESAPPQFPRCLIEPICIQYESSEEATKQHAEYAKDVGYDEEAGRFDADMTETNQSTSKPDCRNMLLRIIDEAQNEGDKGAPRELIMEVMIEKYGFDEDKVEHHLRKLSREDVDVYEPRKGEFGML